MAREKRQRRGRRESPGRAEGKRRRTDGAEAAGPRLPGWEGRELRPPGAQGTPMPAREHLGPRGSSSGGAAVTARGAGSTCWPNLPGADPGARRDTPAHGEPEEPRHGPRNAAAHGGVSAIPTPGLSAPLGAAARPRRSSPCGSAACRGLRARTARSACGPSAEAAAAPRRSRTPPWRPQAPPPARRSVCRSVRPPPRCRTLPRAAEPRARPRPGAFPQPAAACGRRPGGSPLPAARRAPATPPPPRPPIGGEQRRARANGRAGPERPRPRNVGVAHAANGAAERRARQPMGQRQDCGRRAPPRPQGGTRDGTGLAPGIEGPGQGGQGEHGLICSAKAGENAPCENHNVTALGRRTGDAGACLRSVPERSSTGSKNNPSQREMGYFKTCGPAKPGHQWHSIVL